MNARIMAMSCCLATALMLAGCPAEGTDAGTDAAVGTDSAMPAVCGNDILELGEECDGTDVANRTCTSLNMGFNGGTLGCSPDCTMLDTSTCRTPDYSCVGMNTPPPPAGANGDLTFRVENFSTPGLGIEGIVVDAFDITDLTETTSLATATTDALGDATLTVPLGMSGWDGFLRFVPMDPMYKSAYYVQNFPIVDNTSLGTLPTVDGTTWVVFHAFGGIAMPDPTLGAIGAALVDCAGNPAPSMTMMVTPTDATTVVAYLVSGFPDIAAAESDAQGQGVVFHSAVGQVTVTAFAPPMPGMMPIQVATATIEVRPDVLTTLQLYPN